MSFYRLGDEGLFEAFIVRVLLFEIVNVGLKIVCVEYLTVYRRTTQKKPILVCCF